MQALAYVDGLSADGGTEMMPALRSALEAPADFSRVRFACVISDGEVSNDHGVLAVVRENAGVCRFFPIGIGDSVNRYLLGCRPSIFIG